MRGNENTEADNIVGNNIIEDNAIENQLHFGHDNMLFESNRDNEDNNDWASISSKDSIDSRKARRGSLVKEIIEKSNAVCISLDLEHGGDKCGVTQLSAVLFRLRGVEDSALSKDVMIREVFNEYVQPPLSAKWNPICREKTGLHPHHPKILQADPFEAVWSRFKNYLSKYIYGKKRESSSPGMARPAMWNGCTGILKHPGLFSHCRGRP